METVVSYDQQSFTLPLLVIVGNEGLEKITNWHTIHEINVDQLWAVLTQYTEFFNLKFSMIKDFKATL